MGSSLHLVDFIIQNMHAGTIDRTTTEGESALHLSARHDRAEAMKLLLRAGADPTLRNKQEKTPLDIAQEMGHHTCKELVRKSLLNRKNHIYITCKSLFSSATLFRGKRHSSIMSTLTGISLTMRDRPISQTTTPSSKTE